MERGCDPADRGRGDEQKVEFGLGNPGTEDSVTQTIVSSAYDN
jgi:hypothetical protein